MAENPSNDKPITRSEFIQRFGGVFEHSPWVAEAVWERYPQVAKTANMDELIEVFSRVVRIAPQNMQLDLLRAHPDLACGVVSSKELTPASKQEQASAGLDQCSPEEFIEFQTLNLEYKKEFGFPFILAVRDMDRQEILRHFRRRIERSPDEEFSTAIENVIRIASQRISNLFASRNEN